jgi:arylsulfatase A-like enzyme
MTNRPNIVFLLADQLRASSIPVYGEDQIETPNIDRLAQEGITFTNSVATCPVCTPYRSMLLTGRHPQTTGHVINFMRTRRGCFQSCRLSYGMGGKVASAHWIFSSDRRT